MSVVDTVKLLEQRTQKAASLISILRKEKAALAQQLQEAEGRPVADPETERKLAESEAKNVTLNASLTEAEGKLEDLVAQLADLQKKFDELQANYNLVNTHNEELEDYVEKFQTSNKLIEESINAAMANLNSIEGLDDTPIEVGTESDLAAAEEFTNGGALANNEVVDDSLLDDTPAAPAGPKEDDDLADMPIDNPLPYDETL